MLFSDALFKANNMSEMSARTPKVDWEKGVEKHWNGGVPETSHIFNALSFIFPQAETYILRVAKQVYRQEDLELSKELAEDLKVFYLQEAMHTKYHQQFNGVLERQGYRNVTYDLIARLEKISYKKYSAVQRLAFVCAYEHFSAVLGNFLLRNPQVLKDAPKQMSLFWEWHAAEETEHKSVCFDLFEAAGGTWRQRVFSYFVMAYYFIMGFTRLYLTMLRQDGCFKLKNIGRTLWRSTRFFWGYRGVSWYILFHAPRYLSPTFHPWNQNNRRLFKRWLTRNDRNLRKL